MTKKQIVDRLSEQFCMDKQDVKRIIDGFIVLLAISLRETGRAEIRGFGALRTVQRKAYSTRSPLTGQEYEVPPSKVLHFKPGKMFLRGVCGRGF